MIKFIQRYQKFFYIVITTVTVISFSFFGTYGSLSAPSERDFTAFTTIGGNAITRNDLEEMTAFIQTDLDDKKLYGPQWGPNFLNDGVIQKDFLQNGLALMLVQAYPQYFEKDLASKIQKESAYTPYVHPQAPYISAEGAWRYFAPNLKGALDAIKTGGDPLSNEMLGARVDLYLSQKSFPAPYLAEVLRRQEGQYEWVKKDPNLNGRDLSLFGYQSVDDWFGPRFTRMIAEFIFNAAEVAESKGYKVTREEAWADLLVNGSESYQEVSRYPEIATLSQGKYIGEQLRRMGFDKTRAVDVWQKVLLFRRMFHDIANGTLVAPDLFKAYGTWANASVTGNTYNLPRALRFSGLLDLAEFELYLDKTTAENSGIDLPLKGLSPKEVQKNSPELVEKRALVQLKQANKKTLEARVSLKDTLNWQVIPENFAKLKKTFPDLGISNAENSEARIEALDALSDRTRSKVDSYTRSEIVAENNDWVESALKESEAKEEVISIRLKGGKDPIIGASDRISFLKALETAEKGKSIRFNGKDSIYEIEVLDISPDWEVVTFEAARENGSLSELLTVKLNPIYQEIRDKDSKKYRSASGTWKPLEEVKREVAEQWLQPKLELIKKESENSLKGENTPLLISETLPGFRFVGWASKVRGAKDKTPYISEGTPPTADETKLPFKGSWGDQFKWQVTERVFPRKSLGQFTPGQDKLFTLNEGDFSPLLTPANGDIQFVEVLSRSNTPDQKATEETVLNLRNLIGSETQRDYMKSLILKIKENNGISFGWLDLPNENVLSREG